MESKIIFLGSGTGSVVRGKQLLGTGGFVLKTGNNQLLVDPGPGCLIKARDAGVNLRETTAILVSHAHLTHSNDLNAAISAMTYDGMDKKGVLVLNKTVLHGAEGYRKVLDDHYKDMVERVIEIEPGKRIAVEDIEIQGLACIHSEPNTVGFKVHAPDFVLAYSSDTEFSEDLYHNYADSDILILNVPSPTKIDFNLCKEDAVKIIEKAKPKIAIVGHFNNEMLKADPLQMARDIARFTRIQTIAAKDGLTISPSGYASITTQKTLGGF